MFQIILSIQDDLITTFFVQFRSGGVPGGPVLRGVRGPDRPHTHSGSIHQYARYTPLHTALYCTLHSNAHCTLLHTAMYFTLHCTVYFTALHCTVNCAVQCSVQ